METCNGIRIVEERIKFEEVKIIGILVFAFFVNFDNGFGGEIINEFGDEVIGGHIEISRRFDVNTERSFQVNGWESLVSRDVKFYVVTILIDELEFIFILNAVYVQVAEIDVVTLPDWNEDEEFFDFGGLFACDVVEEVSSDETIKWGKPCS